MRILYGIELARERYVRTLLALPFSIRHVTLVGWHYNEAPKLITSVVLSFVPWKGTHDHACQKHPIGIYLFGDVDEHNVINR